MNIFRNKGNSNKEKVIFELQQLIDAIESNEIELSENIMDISAPYAYDINLVRSQDESIYGIIYKNKIKNEKLKMKNEPLKSIFEDEQRAINNKVILPIKESKKKSNRVVIENICDKVQKKRGRPKARSI